MQISLRKLAVVTAGGALAAAMLALRSSPAPPMLNPAATRSADCASCHVAQAQAWQASHHAKANRVLGDGAQKMAIGVAPLLQTVHAGDGGRWLVPTRAYHPASGSWFDVTGAPGPSAVWNSSCAYCHMTGFHKGYRPSDASFASTWLEHGVGCAGCHGRVHGETAAFDRSTRVTETCLACHSLREELTAEAFVPGDRFNDHFRLELLDRPLTFWPDGQVRDEAFEGASFLSSAMGGHGGVHCTDCHDPHSGKLRAPLAGNQLCLCCHGSGAGLAPKIADAQAHSHHRAGSAGHQCEGCHMPVKVFMQRHPRRDHGFGKPDPRLTQELGLPNACNGCHTDRDTDWAVQWSERWYGARLDGRQRQRARSVARAWAGQGEALQDLLDLLASERLPAWRAALTGLLARWAGHPRVHNVLQDLLTDPEPLVRAASVRALADQPDRLALLAPLINDPLRLVRLDAAYALREEAVAQPDLLPAAVWREVRAWLDQTADSPLGAQRRTQWYALRRKE